MRRRHLVIASAAVLSACGALTAVAQTPQRSLTARLAATELTYGAHARIDGALTDAGGPVAGEVVEAQADAFPYRGYVSAELTRTRADGSYVFTSLKPGRNTRYRVVDHGPGAVHSAPLNVIVDPTYRLRSRSRGPGNTLLIAAVHHTGALASPAVRVYWFVTRPGGRRFRLAAVSSTHEIRHGVTFASAQVDPPAKRFVYRVCFTPRWGRAMGPPGSHRPCHHRDYTAARPVG